MTAEEMKIGEEMGYPEMLNRIKQCLETDNQKDAKKVFERFVEMPLIQTNVGIETDGYVRRLKGEQADKYGVNSCLLMIIEMLKFNIKFKTQLKFNYEIILNILDTNNNFHFILELSELLKETPMKILFMIRGRLMDIEEVICMMNLMTIVVKRPVFSKETHSGSNSETNSTNSLANTKTNSETNSLGTSPESIDFTPEPNSLPLKLPYSESQFKQTIKQYMAINEITETLLAAKK